MAGGFVLVGCEQEEVVPPKHPIYVTQGRLVFETPEVFSNTVRALLDQQEDLESLIQWKEKFNYLSMWETYKEIAKSEEKKRQIAEQQSVAGFEDVVFLNKNENGELEAIPTISNHIFQMLFNYEGVLQIGESIYKQDYEFLKVIRDGDVSKLPLLKNIKSTDEGLGIDVFPISRTTVDKGTNPFNIVCEQSFGSNSKQKGEIKYVDNGIWMTLSASTCNFKKSFGIWWLHDAYSIFQRIHAQYTFWERLEPLHVWESQSKDRTVVTYTGLPYIASSIDFTFEYCDSFSNDECYVDTQQMEGTHKVKPVSSSSQGSCSTNY